MQLLQSLVPILISLSLAGVVLAVGLNSGVGDLLYVLRHPKRLTTAIFSVLIFPPIAAGLLISMAPLEPIVKFGIMMMAISPVPPLVPGKGLTAGARKSYAYGLYVAMALLTIVSVPLVSAIAGRLFNHPVVVPMSTLLKTILAGVIVPIAIGLAISNAAPDFAKAAWRHVYRISLGLVVLAALPLIVKMWPAIADMVGNGTVAAMAGVSLITLLCGHLLGGPDIRDRATLAIASSVRHPGIAMSIGAGSVQDPRLPAAIVLFMLVSILVSFPYTAWVKRKTAHALPRPPETEHRHHHHP